MLQQSDRRLMRGFELSHARRPAAALAPRRGRGSGRRAISRRPDRAGVAAGQAFSRRHRAAAARATPGFAEGYRVQALIDAARRSHQQGRLDRRRGGRRQAGAQRERILVTGGSGFIGSALVQGAGQGRRKPCACSTTIRAARRAGWRTSRTTSSSSPAISATPRPSTRRCAASTRSTISPSSTARNSSTARRSSCSTSASRAWSM